MQERQSNELMRLNEVIELVRYSKASIYRLMSEGRFPKAISLGGRSVFWVRSQIEDFINEKIKDNAA